MNLSFGFRAAEIMLDLGKHKDLCGIHAAALSLLPS